MQDGALAARRRRAVRSRARRRIPGHEHAAGGDPARAEARGRGPVRRRRRCAVDLFVPRRDGREHPRVSRSSSRRRRTSSRSRRTTARRQPILDAANALIGEAPRQYQKALQSQRACGQSPAALVTVLDEQAQADYVVERILQAREQGVLLQAPGGALSQLAPQRRARARARAPQHPVREIRRAQVPRSRAREGPARGAALGRQPAQPHRRVPRAAAPAGRRPRGRGRCLDAFEASSHDWSALAGYRMPAAARRGLVAARRAPARARRARARVGRAGDARARAGTSRISRGSTTRAVPRAGDLEQLERIATQFAARERS